MPPKVSGLDFTDVRSGAQLQEEVTPKSKVKNMQGQKLLVRGTVVSLVPFDWRKRNESVIRHSYEFARAVLDIDSGSEYFRCSDFRPHD
jgi:hypothetical protein